MHWLIVVLEPEELSTMLADPENGQVSESLESFTMEPAAIFKTHPLRFVSKPAFLIRFPGLGCGQVHALAPQQRPPHVPVVHSAVAAQIAPVAFFGMHEPFEQ